MLKGKADDAAFFGLDTGRSCRSEAGRDALVMERETCRGCAACG